MNHSVGVPMTAVRVARLLGITILFLICLSCGENYRPVATPLSPNPPNPAFTHFMVVLSTNGTTHPGAATTLDVSGDTMSSQSSTGLTPTYAAYLTTGIYVANRDDDTVSVIDPNAPTTVTTITLPTGAAPDFLATTQNSAVFVANAGNNTVSAINLTTNIVTNTINVGTDPVAMAELPSNTRLYVANAGSGGTGGSLTSINTLDYSVNPPIAGLTWTSPVWVLARSDSQRLFVLDKGAGTVIEIDTSGVTDSVVASVPVGVGADYMIYDKTLSRLYVTNPVNNTVYVLDASDAVTGTVSQLATIPVTGAASVAALPDGSRFYVASAVVNGAAVTSSVVVVDAGSFTVEKTIPITSVPQTCASYMNTPNELSTAASLDSTRVYVGNCDAGSTAIIATVANSSPGGGASQDSLVLSLPAPYSAQSPPNGGTPPPQNPVLVISGQ
jgi:YVTN family beta-propeller protein